MPAEPAAVLTVPPPLVSEELSEYSSTMLAISKAEHSEAVTSTRVIQEQSSESQSQLPQITRLIDNAPILATVDYQWTTLALQLKFSQMESTHYQSTHYQNQTSSIF